MTIPDIHEDIIKTHILTKLDGQTLVSAGCVSSNLHTFCSDEKLWSKICHSNWPSTDHQIVTKAVSNFTAGHRSFFSDTFPSPTSHLTSTVTTSPTTPQIISSVDIKYDNKLIFSKVEVTNTKFSDWFETSPFLIDLLEPKEIVPCGVEVFGNDKLESIEKHVTLSWIMIDPTRNRAVNVSSGKPVLVQRNWLTNDIELTFSKVILHENQHVSCNIQVTCGVNGGNGELHISGVSFMVLDIDGKCLSGKDSMVILQGLMVVSRRISGGEEERVRYDEFIKMRKERNVKKEKKERWLDLACVTSGVAMFMAFWSFALC
uniref:F-box protein At2g27310-like n=1 Tax=Erigeron canadensis TaxID=72917 RepID=UPI001CB914BA|nr:F-box protein At2g27310-like [Erigeron canadensis]